MSKYRVLALIALTVVIFAMAVPGVASFPASADQTAAGDPGDTNGGGGDPGDTNGGGGDPGDTNGGGGDPGDTNGKVTICHKEHVTLSVASSALPAHLAHGDTEGACD